MGRSLAMKGAKTSWREHIEYARVAGAVAAHAGDAVALEVTAFRSVEPRYAKLDLAINGKGAMRGGGRWNSPGLTATVYLTLTPETAMAETMAHARRYGFAEADVLPRVFLAVDVRVQRVLDLRSGWLRRVLRVSRERMLGTDWVKEQSRGHESLTQALGRACYEAGLEGLVAPSAADPKGSIVVIFPGKLGKESGIRVRTAAV